MGSVSGSCDGKARANNVGPPPHPSRAACRFAASVHLGRKVHEKPSWDGRRTEVRILVPPSIIVQVAAARLEKSAGPLFVIHSRGSQCTQAHSSRGGWANSTSNVGRGCLPSLAPKPENLPEHPSIVRNPSPKLHPRKKNCSHVHASEIFKPPAAMPTQLRLSPMGP